MLSEPSSDIDSSTPVLPVCINCNLPLEAGGNFCRHCGYAQTANDPEAVITKWNGIRQIILFFLIGAVICCMASFISVFHTLFWSIAADISLGVVAVIFFTLNWSVYKSLLVWHNFSFSRLLGYCSVAIIGSVIVGFSVDWLNNSLFSRHFSYYAFYAPYKHGKELAIFFIAVMPALFEE